MPHVILMIGLGVVKCLERDDLRDYWCRIHFVLFHLLEESKGGLALPVISIKNSRSILCAMIWPLVIELGRIVCN